MARDEDDDLYDEEFDFVDDDEDDDSDFEDESPLDEESQSDADEGDEPELDADRDGAVDAEEPVDEYGRPEPAANYVVHVYEYNKYKRTIDRPFTPEDAEAFATEFNRTGKSYGRVAVSGKNDIAPKKSLD